MEKEISFYEFQSVRNVAKAIDPLIREQGVIEAKIEKAKEDFEAKVAKLQQDYQKVQQDIDGYEEGIVRIIGFHVLDLVKKVIEPGIDKNGKETKTTKYLPTDRVRYNEATKRYVISMPDAEQTEHDNPEVPSFQ